MFTIRSLRKPRGFGLALILLICLSGGLQAGFINPNIGIDTPTQFTAFVDFVPGGGNPAILASANWTVTITQVALGGGGLGIDSTGQHQVGPHGEAAPGPLLITAFGPVAPGGAFARTLSATSAPTITSSFMTSGGDVV